jgi:hypothetical protein
MPYQYKREPLTPDESNRLSNACEGYPRKAGHPTLSTTSRHDLIALQRSRQVFDLR